jgi:hypothetical protein
MHGEDYSPRLRCACRPALLAKRVKKNKIYFKKIFISLRERALNKKLFYSIGAFFNRHIVINHFITQKNSIPYALNKLYPSAG